MEVYVLPIAIGAGRRELSYHFTELPDAVNTVLADPSQMIDDNLFIPGLAGIGLMVSFTSVVALTQLFASVWVA